jgi:predicted SAM-dependent methyltransferase
VSALLIWVFYYDISVYEWPRETPMTVRCHLNLGFLQTYYSRRFGSPRLTSSTGKQICSTGVYSFEYEIDAEKPGPKTWAEVAELPCKYINLGDGRGNYHDYENYVGVTAGGDGGETKGWGCEWNRRAQRQECGEWCVCQDLRKSIPLANSSVDRIHTEDFIEHIDHWHYPALLAEIHRLLKRGGRARIACPDYGRMSNAKHWKNEAEPMPDGVHTTLTNYALFKKYVEESPFKKAEWYDYHDNTVPGVKLSGPSRHLPDGAYINSPEHPLPFIHKEIDHSLGVVKRTPEVDCRNNMVTGWDSVTSLVFDLVKE